MTAEFLACFLTCLFEAEVSSIFVSILEFAIELRRELNALLLLNSVLLSSKSLKGLYLLSETKLAFHVYKLFISCLFRLKPFIVFDFFDVMLDLCYFAYRFRPKFLQ